MNITIGSDGSYQPHLSVILFYNRLRDYFLTIVTHKNEFTLRFSKPTFSMTFILLYIINHTLIFKSFVILSQ